MEYCKQKERKINPRETANVLSLLSFTYCIQIFKKGYKKSFEEDDLYEVAKNCESKYCGDKLEKKYLKEKLIQKEPSLFKTLFKLHGFKYLLLGTTQVTADLLKSVLEPTAVSNLVRYFSPGQTELTKLDAYYNTAVILVVNFFHKIFFYNFDLYLFILGIEVRTSICSCLFRKIVKLSPGAVSQGNIITLVTKDVQQIRRSMFLFNDLWVFFIIVLVTCYLLYSRIGAVSLIATGVFMCAVPLQAIIGKLIHKLRMKTSQKTDQRLQIIQEALTAIKIIKMYTWEEIFKGKINAARRYQISIIVIYEIFSTPMVYLITRRSILNLSWQFCRLLIGQFAVSFIHRIVLYNIMTRTRLQLLEMSHIFGRHCFLCPPRSSAAIPVAWLAMGNGVMFILTLTGIFLYIFKRANPNYTILFFKREVAQMILVFYLRIFLFILGVIVSKISLYLLIMAYIWMEQPTDASVVFFITAHFNGLNTFYAHILPDALGKVAEFLTAMTRVNNVLIAEEVQISEPQEPILDPLIELKNVTVNINDNQILKDINLSIKPGLTLITGRVGSGKSCLLKTILREYPIKNGEVIIKGRISYASQNPWLFPSTIKQNILFGEEFNEKRYNEVLKICALEYDLNLFEKGDETIVSDNGQNLSKGQQARINLARAIYKNSNIYLLDDCLSGLDKHVHNFIYNECIKKFLQDKICIFVTQDENKLKNEDNVFVINNKSINLNSRENLLQEKQFSIIENIELKYENDYNSLETDKLLETEQTNYKNIYEEKLKQGSVDKDVYKKYINFGGGFFILFINLLLIGFYQASESYSEKLLSLWSDQKQTILNIQTNITKNISALELAESQASSTFKTYSIMITISVLSEIIRTYTFLNFCRNASLNIHKNMVQNIIHAVMSFFDSHFIGNILNRFSQDIINIDENLPFQLNACLASLFDAGGSTILLISINLYFSIYALILFASMIYLLKLYLPVARNLQRLEASTRSPMIGHLNAALEGMTTIRAYKAEQMVIEEYEKHQNVFTSAHYTCLVYHYGFGFFMQMLATSMIAMVVLSFLFIETGTSAGSVGLGLTQVIFLGSTVQHTVKSWADLENMMTATERALEYTNITTESKNQNIVKNWPNAGNIKYDNVSLTYNNSELILNKLNFDISSKEKIGVVGRTGAGKSSIISTIFRLYEVEGNIIIDNINIKNIPLKSLRTNLAIIPQDPVLFSGTIRSNLDPFGHFKDEELWNALEKANLKFLISKLDMEVSPGAFNFSLGQKQMICVARAILAKAKILILDEATANMDQETEMLIHNTIKENFSECTVLTIAHRLQSILECERVMVLDRGEIKEFNNPKELLKNQESYFYKMVQHNK